MASAFSALTISNSKDDIFRGNESEEGLVVRVLERLEDERRIAQRRKAKTVSVS